jgi:hypothetical protein
VTRRRVLGVLPTLALLLSACGSAGGADRAADEQPDTCAVFTTSEVGDFLAPYANTSSDDRVLAGKHTGGGEGCYYATSMKGASFFLHAQVDDTAAKFDDSRRLAVAQHAVVTDLPQVAGDGAFVADVAAARSVSAQARRGSLRVRVVFTGGAGTNDTATAALQEAVSRLGRA